MVTMKQIANRAGVSISTVSLVLNNRDIGRVSPDVAERVRDIAAELGYLTNRLASGLRTSSTRTIGFLSDEVATTPFAGRMIEGAQDAARMPAFFDKHPDVDGFFFNDTRAWAIYTEATRRGADYRQRYRGGWRRQPPGCGRSAGSAAFHCGTAALRDGLLGSR